MKKKKKRKKHFPRCCNMPMEVLDGHRSKNIILKCKVCGAIRK